METKYYGFEIDTKLHEKIKIMAIKSKITMTDIINTKLWELFKVKTKDLSNG